MKNILKIILFLPCIVFADIEVSSDIESVIKQHLHEREGFKVKQVIQGNVAGYNGEVKVVQWTLMGASYWRNYITILDISQNEIEITTKQVYGIVESILLENNLIIVKTKEKGPNDANCCPSVKTARSYKLDKNTIIEVKDPSNQLQATQKPRDLAPF